MIIILVLNFFVAHRISCSNLLVICLIFRNSFQS